VWLCGAWRDRRHGAQLFAEPRTADSLCLQKISIYAKTSPKIDQIDELSRGDVLLEVSESSLCERQSRRSLHNVRQRVAALSHPSFDTSPHSQGTKTKPMDNLMNNFDIALASSKAVAIAKTMGRMSFAYVAWTSGREAVAWACRPPAAVPKTVWEKFIEWSQEPTVIPCLTAFLLSFFLLLGSLHYGYLVCTVYGPTLKEGVSSCKLISRYLARVTLTKTACGKFKAGCDAIGSASSTFNKSLSPDSFVDCFTGLKKLFRRESGKIQILEAEQNSNATATAISTAIKDSNEGPKGITNRSGEDDWISVTERTGFMRPSESKSK
jgi:hypothetical protein